MTGSHHAFMFSLNPIMGGGTPPRIKNGDLHEMSLQTSYRQKKTTILPHFSRPESWCYYFPQIMKHNHSNDPKTHFLNN